MQPDPRSGVIPGKYLKLMDKPEAPPPFHVRALTSVVHEPDC